MNQSDEIKILLELHFMEESQIASLLNSLSSKGFKPGKKFSRISIHTKVQKDFKKKAITQNPEIDIVKTLIINGSIKKELIKEIEKLDMVKKVWIDTPISHFACAFSPCDCDVNTSKGNIARVAECLGVDKIWDKGFKGEKIVIGIVDGGVDKNEIPSVIGGHLSDFGTQANWGKHGNMTATDALGMAPNCKIYDLRIADDTEGIVSTISNAIEAYDWAISQHKKDGTPHILSNSWGIYQENWDTEYANNPDHPFTRKVKEAIDEGILVLFAAGNCGQGCADSRCKTDIGPGKSIWGANGHPDVMTVGAANICGDLIGYSSQGEASLDKHKPDFCGISHFRGYFPVDTGTSAACPIAAGIVAILKQSDNTLTQDQIKHIILTSATDVGPVNWDIHSGAGIINPVEAFNILHPADQINSFDPNKKCNSKTKIEKECIREERRSYPICVEERITRQKKCSEDREERHYECAREEDRGYNSCEDWWWWLAWICIAWVWVSNIVCVAGAWIVNAICVFWHWVVSIACITWVWITARFCTLYAWNKPCCCYEHLISTP